MTENAVFGIHKGKETVCGLKGKEDFKLNNEPLDKVFWMTGQFL